MIYLSDGYVVAMDAHSATFSSKLSITNLIFHCRAASTTGSAAVKKFSIKNTMYKDKNKEVVGDLPAKMEGRAMIEQSKVSFDLPAFFSDSAGTTASTMVIDELEFARTKEVQNDVATEEKHEAATELQEAMATEASV